jgi:5,6,7,8-tetrahydromethanopterin hydro-lyase
MVSDAKLVYIHKPIPFMAGFTIPIFSNKGRFYIQNSKNGVIDKFDHVELSDDLTLGTPDVSPVAHVGGTEYVSFLTTELFDIIGTRDDVIAELKVYAYKYTNPYVLLEIAEFIQNRELIGQALESINRLSPSFDPLSDIIAVAAGAAPTQRTTAAADRTGRPERAGRARHPSVTEFIGAWLRTHKTKKIDGLRVGEALVGDGNEVAHIDLIIGPRGSAAETAFANALTNNKDGFTTLLAVVAPNLLVKPPTVIFNKVTIKNATQAVQMFGPAQHGVAKAVADSVASGVIPVTEADDLFICVGVFIHWDARDNQKIQDFNYQATKEAIFRAVVGEPTPARVAAQRNVAMHPFAH